MKFSLLIFVAALVSTSGNLYPKVIYPSDAANDINYKIDLLISIVERVRFAGVEDVFTHEAVTDRIRDVITALSIEFIKENQRIEPRYIFQQQLAEKLVYYRSLLLSPE